MNGQLAGMASLNPNDVFQFSTYTALNAGFSENQFKTADIASHGTDGIGVYEDGRLMILKDRMAHAIKGDGAIEPAPMQTHLSFAMVTTFQPPFRAKIPSISLEALDELLSSSDFGPAKGINTLMPFKITAVFESLELEHGTKQDIAGSVVGFVVPMWMKHISGPRIHAHFLDASEEGGGKVLDFQATEEATLRFAKCEKFHMGFPQGEEWENLKL